MRSASRLSRAMLKLSWVTERLDVYNISRKNKLRWNVKQPGEVCVGGRNTRFELIITCVYSWNTQKQEGQLNLMKLKVPLGSYST